MSTVSVAALMKTLAELRLLKPSQLQELTRTLEGKPSEPRALAKELFRRGWLTAYQIRELVHGRGPDLVLGQYVLLEPLGEGGMGRVFKARHRHLNRVVALKILREERLAKPDAARRFYREIQAAAKLSHPNIVVAYDANRVGKRIFFAMEYVDGIDLYQLVKQSGPLPVALACDYIRQAALGLQHAFERGLVHRDIKPPNLLVTLLPGPRGKTAGNDTTPDLSPGEAASRPSPAASEAARGPVVKILDLGLAYSKWAAESDPANSILTQEGTVIGTVDYIAPEQAKNSHQVDIRADLYSLGGTFYYLLTGRAPFPEGTALEKLLKHQGEQPLPLVFLRPDVPAAVAAVVDKLLAKRPEDRYQTPAELAAALASAMAAFGVSPGAPPEPGGAMETLVPERPFPVTPREPMALPSAMPATQDTVESAASWAEIIATPPEIGSRSSLRLHTDAPMRKWLWPAAGLSSLLVAGLVLLAFLLNRPPKPGAGDGESRSANADVSEKQPRHQGSNAPTAFTAQVAANKPWQDTGIQVRADRPVSLVAHGEWRKGQASCSADGLPGEARDRTLVAGAPVLCLLARVGDETTPVALGTSKTLVPKKGGRLFARANTLDWQDCDGSVDLEIRGVGAATGPAPSPGPTRVEAAEAALKPLLAKAAEPRPDPEGLRQGLRGFCLQYSGTPQAVRAAGLLRQFPSPLDKLDPGPIPAAERFAWQPKELVAVLGEHRQRHWGPVSRVAFSPDGQRVASAGGDAVIRVWSAATGKEELLLKGHTGPVSAVFFAPDGTMLLSASGAWNQPGEVKVWDAAKGEERAVVRGYTNVLLAPDGKTFATRTDDGTIKVWDLATGKERATLKGHTAAVSWVAFAPDGQTAASASADTTVKLWDLATGKERHTLKGHTAAVGFVAFAPDGKTVASASADATVKLWDAAGGKEQAALKGHTAEVRSLAFAPDGKTLASGSLDRTVRLWDRSTGQSQVTFQGHTAGVTCVALAADGKTLASGSLDRSVRFWDVPAVADKSVPKPAAGQERHPLGGNLGPALGVAWAPDGSTLAAGIGDGTVRLWGTATGKESAVLQGHTDEVLAVAYAPDGKTLASAGRDKTAKLWDLATGKERVALQGHADAVWSVGFAPDGRPAATGSADRTVKLWDPDNGQVLESIEEQALVLISGHASDGRAVAAPSADQTVKLWQATANQAGFSFAGASTPDVSWVIATDGTTVATRGEERTVKLWDAATQKERVTLPGHAGPVTCAAFAPDGKTVATGSDDQTVKLWDAYTGKEQLTVQGETGPIGFMAFSPDGGKLLSAGNDGRAMILWEVASGKKLNEWRLPGLVYGVAFAPDGRHLATANGNGTVYILRLGLPPAGRKD